MILLHEPHLMLRETRHLNLNVGIIRNTLNCPLLLIVRRQIRHSYSGRIQKYIKHHTEMGEELYNWGDDINIKSLQ